MSNLGSRQAEKGAKGQSAELWARARTHGGAVFNRRGTVCKFFAGALSYKRGKAVGIPAGKSASSAGFFGFPGFSFPVCPIYFKI